MRLPAELQSARVPAVIFDRRKIDSYTLSRASGHARNAGLERFEYFDRLERLIPAAFNEDVLKWPTSMLPDLGINL